MFEGQVDSLKRLNILNDEVEQHYHVIAKLTGAMAKKYVCKGCGKACKRDVAHVCDQTCSDCIHCNDCHRHLRNAAFFANHKLRTSNWKSVCERKLCCETCGWLVTSEKHECYKSFCDTCNESKEIGHLCYMRPLKDAFPPAVDMVFYVFYDFETSQNTEYADEANLHVPNLVCVQQFCSRCEDVEDARECVRFGTKRHSFWQDPVWELLSYLTEPSHWANKIIVIAHNAKAFDLTSS